MSSIKSRENKTVHIIIEGGIVVDAYADCDVDIVVYDLDCQDSDMREEVEKAIANLPDIAHEVEIF